MKTTIKNSKIEELLLTPFRSSNASTNGTVTVTIKNSSINSVLRTENSDILGNVFITIFVSIDSNKITANTVLLGPMLRGTVKNVNLTISDNTIQDIYCSFYI